MFNAPMPPPEDLPTRRQLLRSSAVAICVAAALLVTVVLPAEYGVDPTGIGDVLGLKRMGEIKVALAIEAAADAAADAAAAAALAALSPAPPTGSTGATGEAGPPALRADTISVTLSPDQGREFKLAMSEGAVVQYEWSTDTGVVNYDLHGDIVNPLAGFYHGYRRENAQASDAGTLTAAFDGTHGWFFRNRTQQQVTVTLRVTGEYEEVREIR